MIGQEEVSIVLEKHVKWLRGEPGGERADLHDADLRGVNLHDADLRGVNLRGANLRGVNLCGVNLRGADLCGANLRGVNLRGADLRGVNLCGANLRGVNLHDADLHGVNLYGADLYGVNLCGVNLRDANLRGANLCGVNLRGADLCGAKIDYASWPLWCGSLRVHIDDRQARQLLYHVLSAVSCSNNCSAELKAALLSVTNIAIANQFHRTDECGGLEVHTVTDAEGQ